MRKQFTVKATQDFTLHNHDYSKLLAEVNEGDVITAELHGPTEEYFGSDSQGREVYVGELDVFGSLTLDDSFTEVS